MEKSIYAMAALALGFAGCTEKATPTYTGEDLPPDVAGNTAPSAATRDLNAAVNEGTPLGEVW